MLIKKLLPSVLALLLVLPLVLSSCGAPQTPDVTSDTESASSPAPETKDPSAGESATEPETAPQTPKNVYEPMEVLLSTDVHLCHLNWYGMTSDDRMAKMIDDMNAYHDEYGYSAILFLGDYSLDFWETGIFGSWRHQELSNTKNFLEKYAADLDCENWYIIPGNHEQYGYELWKDITGFDRQYYIKLGGYLVFMLDNFAGDLDPTTDNHGVYSYTDIDFIHEVMDENPEMPVILCAHYFDVSAEAARGTGFRDLVRDDRVMALFCGHDHVRTVQKLGPDYGDKIIFHCGQYSYTKSSVTDCPWGWRTMLMDEDGLTVSYYAPESTMVDGRDVHIEEGFLDEIYVPNLLTHPELKPSDEPGTEETAPDDPGSGEERNLCAEATILAASPGNKEKNGPASLIDGDPKQTKWCVTSDPTLPADLKDIALYYFVMDLGGTRQLKSYTLHGASASEYGGDSGITDMDMKGWVIQGSANKTDWTDLDRVTDNTASVYTHSIDGSVRYIRLLILPGGANQKDDVLRLYELEILGK